MQGVPSLMYVNRLSLENSVNPRYIVHDPRVVYTSRLYVKEGVASLPKVLEDVIVKLNKKRIHQVRQ